MHHSLCDFIEEHGPTPFTLADLEGEPELFAQRAALFYTPTTAIPPTFIGTGPLTVTLPVAPPSAFEYYELQGYRTPRLWVDLIQRATGKLRWTPLKKASVLITRYDSDDYGRHASMGAKALLDALKWRTTGRADRILLYYFGAIEDDGPDYLAEWHFRQEPLSSPAAAHCTISVRAA